MAAVLLVSCAAPSEFEQIPATPFTTHLKKNSKEDAPFLSHWEDETKPNEPAAERRRVCLKLNDDYFQGEEQLDKSEKKKLAKLRNYLGRTLRKELRRNPKLRLVSAPAEDADVLEVALLRAEDANTAKLLLAQGAGKMVAGGMLTDGLVTNDADKGSVCIAVKLSAPDGTLLAELADFEYGGKEQGITDGLISAAAPVAVMAAVVSVAAMGAGGAMAAVIAEEMARTFGEVEVGGEGEELANEGHPYTKCPGCGKFMSPNGTCQNCGFVEDNDRMIARGKKAVSTSTTGNPKSVKNAMYKKGLGTIDFELGWEGKGKGMDGGSGMLKLVQKHRDDIPHLPETIVKGKIVAAEKTIINETTGKREKTGMIDENRIYVIDHPYFATLRRRPDNTGWTVTSHYKSGEECIRYESRASELTRPSK